MSGRTVMCALHGWGAAHNVFRCPDITRRYGFDRAGRAGKARLRLVERRPAAASRGAASALGRRGFDRAPPVPPSRDRGRAAGRPHRPCRRRDAARGASRAVARTVEGNRGDRPRQRHHDGAGRHAVGNGAEGGGGGRALPGARHRRARRLPDRRQCRDQCRRQSCHPLRHDAGAGAGARDRPGGRHDPELAHQGDEEQCRL